MPPAVVAAGVGAAGAIGGGMIASSASKKASKAQAAAQQAGLDAQERMFLRQTELQEPFREAGITAQNQLLNYMGLGTPTDTTSFGKYARDFGAEDFTQDPGYAFRLSEGQKAIDRSAAARGGLQSGSALKAAARYGQDMGSQEYQNAFNRYQVNRSNQLNPLQSLMGAGQSATNTMTSSAANYGNQMNEGLTGIGNARASGYVGGANALTSAIGQGLNFGQNMMYMNQMSPSSGGVTLPYNSSGSNLPYTGFQVPIGGNR